MANLQENINVISTYLRAHAEDMFRQPTERLQYPYMVPGGHYSTDLWDWDSFWAGKAMLALCRYEEKHNADKAHVEGLKRRTATHVKGSVLNFFDMMSEDGFTPIMTTADAILEKELWKMKAEGCVNQHKPFLAQSAYQAATFTDDFSWLQEKLEKLESYFAFYKRNQYVEQCGLYVFNNDVMIGMDNTPVVFGRPERSGADMLLNCFLVEEFRCMQEICRRVGAMDKVAYYQTERDNLIAAIEKYCYDEYYGFYFGVDVQVTTHKSQHFHHGIGAFWNVMPLKIRAWTGFLPMFAGFVPKDRAEKLVGHYHDERFGCNYGIRTLAADELMYSEERSSNPSNWLGPVWGISNYLVFEGFKKYGYHKEAKDLAEKTVQMFADDIRENGEMSESYFPNSGKGMLCQGFLNWNILVVEMIEYLLEA